MPVTKCSKGGKVYLITNKVNGKQYVGQTIRTVEQRFNQHCRADSVIGVAIRKYGEINFTVEQIDSATTLEELSAKEVYWIKEYDSYRSGYNCTLGGESTHGFKHSEETRQKMSEDRRGRYVGEGNHFYGKQHSDKTKLEMAKKKRVGVLMIDLDTGEVLREFDSNKSAYAYLGKAVGGCISKVCKGTKSQAFGYKWQYKEG